jgi:hypothetical protein
MNSQKQTFADNVAINRTHWDVPVQVELQAYLRFSRKIDGQLRRLLIRWQHTASPWARGKLPIVEQITADTPAPPVSES